MTSRFSMMGTAPPGAAEFLKPFAEAKGERLRAEGLKPWTDAERDRILAECEGLNEAARRKLNAKNNHGWDAIMARMADPERFRAKVNGDRKD